jgi:hypothetical protein
MASSIRHDKPKHLKRWTLPQSYFGASWAEGSKSEVCRIASTVSQGY